MAAYRLGPVTRVLWIDEEATGNAAYMTTYVYQTGEYDLALAVSASEGESKLQAAEFDIVIFDIRIGPGHLPHWQNLYKASGNDRARARLGLELIFGLFQQERAAIKLDCPAWLRPRRCGVLSVVGRRELEAEIGGLNFGACEHKAGLPPANVLLETIRRVRQQADA